VTPDVRVVIRHGMAGELVAEGGFVVLASEQLADGAISLTCVDPDSDDHRRLHLILSPSIASPRRLLANAARGSSSADPARTSR
jgi:hypothetical protein